MELDETGDLGQLGVAAQPHLLEGLFGASLHAESVHGNEHHPSPGPGQNVAVIGGVPHRKSLRPDWRRARRARVRDNMVAARHPLSLLKTRFERIDGAARIWPAPVS